MNLVLSNIGDIELDGINYSDAMDFCDAYISNASYKDPKTNEWRDMTEEELDELNMDAEFVYEQVLKQIF